MGGWHYRIEDVPGRPLGTYLVIAPNGKTYSMDTRLELIRAFCKMNNQHGTPKGGPWRE